MKELGHFRYHFAQRLSRMCTKECLKDIDNDEKFTKPCHVRLLYAKLLKENRRIYVSAYKYLICVCAERYINSI